MVKVLSWIQRVFEVNQHEQTSEYRAAVRMFESAFAACERVPEVDRQLLLREMSNRITEMLHASNEPVKPKPIQVVGVEIK